jgi:hypothetical protein
MTLPVAPENATQIERTADHHAKAASSFVTVFARAASAAPAVRG